MADAQANLFAQSLDAALAGMPPLRGRIRRDAELSPTNWFRVGGPADVLFRPEDREDLSTFLSALPKDVPRLVLGVGSNLIIRDGGIEGVVIKLGRGFATWDFPQDDMLEVGAALLCAQAAELACGQGLAGLEFLVGIPGNIGGALAMNAGAYGREMAEVLIAAEWVDAQGGVHRATPAELHYRYRTCELPAGGVFTRAWLRGTPHTPSDEIAARMAEITAAREASQPVRARTGGSTFKNPEGHKAWALIDAAGCRGLQIGGAQMSEKHCNFMINTGTATAADLEALGEEVIRRVQAHSGVTLQWEIKRVGRAG